MVGLLSSCALGSSSKEETSSELTAQQAETLASENAKKEAPKYTSASVTATLEKYNEDANNATAETLLPTLRQLLDAVAFNGLFTSYSEGETSTTEVSPDNFRVTPEIIAELSSEAANSEGNTITYYAVGNKLVYCLSTDVSSPINESGVTGALYLKVDQTLKTDEYSYVTEIQSEGQAKVDMTIDSQQFIATIDFAVHSSYQYKI